MPAMSITRTKTGGFNVERVFASEAKHVQEFTIYDGSGRIVWQGFDFRSAGYAEAAIGIALRALAGQEPKSLGYSREDFPADAANTFAKGFRLWQSCNPAEAKAA